MKYEDLTSTKRKYPTHKTWLTHGSSERPIDYLLWIICQGRWRRHEVSLATWGAQNVRAYAYDRSKLVGFLLACCASSEMWWKCVSYSIACQLSPDITPVFTARRQTYDFHVLCDSQVPVQAIQMTVYLNFVVVQFCHEGLSPTIIAMDGLPTSVLSARYLEHYITSDGITQNWMYGAQDETRSIATHSAWVLSCHNVKINLNAVYFLLFDRQKWASFSSHIVGYPGPKRLRCCHAHRHPRAAHRGATTSWSETVILATAADCTLASDITGLKLIFTHPVVTIGGI